MDAMPFLLLLFLAPSTSADAVGCFVDGECTGGIVLHHTQTATAEDCARACEGLDEGCNYFSHYRLSGMCLLFDTCPNLQQDCVDCVSGRNGCSCMEVGKCDGHTIDGGYALDEFACVDRCRANATCNWMTYTKSLKFCSLLEDCLVLDDSYEDDVSAPKFCGGEDPMHIIAAVGQNSSGDMDDVEIVNVGPGSSTCTKPPAYPVQMYQSSGAFVDGKARICGGRPSTSDCYEYALGDDEWTLSDYALSADRYWHTSFVLPNGTWLILGGSAGRTTDIYEGGVMSQGPSLPVGMDFDFATGTMVNSSHIFVSGGDPFGSSYLIDVDAWEFTSLPTMATGRWDFSCGMVQNKDGEMELVVAGGDDYSGSPYFDVVEIFNFDKWEWRAGTSLPHPVSQGKAVQLSKTFLVMGGYGGSSYLDTVYEFDGVNDQWITRDQKLETERQFFVAIPLPNEWDVC